MLACLEFLGFLQRTADQEQERHDQAANQERNAPAPGRHLVSRQHFVEHHADQRGEHHGNLLAARLPRAIEAFVALGGDLRQIDRHAAQFNPGGKALQQPAAQHEYRREHTDGRVAWYRRHCERAERHQPECEDQAFAPAVMVDVGTQHDGAKRPHQKARAEYRQRQHQRGEFVAAREIGLGNRGCVIAVDHEVVHLKKVAADDAKNCLDLGFFG
ncbi:hypothetical protein R75483_00875 [Paraburkholderia domus]|nr:hypothetical protein R75483_00875 [Paraburkholderia domus]